MTDASQGTVPTVAVVIPAYEQARYLADALDSVIAQTVPAHEIVVVDNGSSDDPAAVAARYPQVRLIRLETNLGPSAARNEGIRAARSDYVICLDADDTLMPDAIERGLACMARHPGAGFVYGAHRRVDAALRPTTAVQFVPVRAQPYHDLLRTNVVGMIATALFDRAKLVECGLFDPAIRICEDYDCFLRMARRYPVGCHGAVVALYRIHGRNSSSDAAEVLAAALAVQRSHAPDQTDHVGQAALRDGKRLWAKSYANAAWKAADKGWRQRLKIASISLPTSVGAAIRQMARRVLPESAASRLKRMVRRQPQIGAVDMGSFARVTPISPNFGYDRGTPIDRHYIEHFLDANRADIRGRVLEIGDASYSKRFGSGVTRQDVLHVDPSAPEATITGDLSQAGVLPEAAFDCMVITQTLHLIYDMRAALVQMHDALRPGGVLLLTVPGVSTVDRNDWAGTWYWALTGQSAGRLLGEVFGPGQVEVTVRGNVYAATSFLHGLAVEEVERDWLDRDDPAYPMVVCVRARRAG